MSKEIDYHDYRTDKWKNHTYMEVYERIFARLRDKKVKLLEVGICSGGCLLLWKDFFAKGSIIEGLDNNIVIVMMDKMKEANIKIHDTFVEDWTPDHSYDIIIDDASHEAHAQARDFKRLWPYISSRGVYVIEDVNEFFEHGSKDGQMAPNDHGIQDFCNLHGINLEKYQGTRWSSKLEKDIPNPQDVMWIFTHKSYIDSLKPLTIWQKIVKIFKP